MRTKIKKFNIAFSLFSLSTFMFAQSPLEINYQAAKKEAVRTQEKMELNGKKPFIVSIGLKNSASFSIVAELGNLVRCNDNSDGKSMTGDVSVLVGDYNRTQTHSPSLMNRQTMLPLAVDGNELSTQMIYWFIFDQMFKQSVMGYDRRLGDISQNNYSKEELSVPELLPIKPLVMYGSVQTPQSFDINKWKEITCKLSAIFLKYPTLERSAVTMHGEDAVTRVFTTEGSEYWLSDKSFKVMLSAAVKDNNGSYVTDRRALVFKNLDPATAIAELTPKIEEYAQGLANQPTLPRIDELYTGPVLFEDQAVVDVIYYNILPMVTAGRYPLGSMSGKNDERIGKVVFSPLLTVKDLAGTKLYKGKELPGYYPYDDNGVVPPAELTLVEDGKLVNLLMGRVPMKNYREGNGHFRNRGNNIGNLFVSVKGAKSIKALRKDYINIVKKAGEPYAYVISRVIMKDIYQITRIDVKTGEETLMREGTLELSSSAFRNILGASKEVYEQTDLIGCWVHYNVPKVFILDNVKIDRKPLVTPEKEPIVSRPILTATN